MKIKKVNLLEGNIGSSLIKLSIPVILTSLLQIVYNLSDTKFISYFLGDSSVSAAAAASFYLGLSFAITTIPRIGTQILVAQMIGAKQEKYVRRFARAGLQLSFILGIILSIIVYFFTPQLIKIVGITNPEILNNSVYFLLAHVPGMPFFFITLTISLIMTADGDTLGPFIFNTIGIVINIFLDYFFLGILKMGIFSVGFATSISFIISFIMLAIYFNRDSSRFKNINIFKINRIGIYNKIMALGFPVGMEFIFYSLIAIQIAKVIAGINENALGIQRLGIQFEAFSWNIAGGVASALSTFVAQNYGAKQFDRLIIGLKKSIIVMSLMGIFITLIFINYGTDMYAMFLSDKELILEGSRYITIIGYSQAFQSVDKLVMSGYNGMGQTKIPLMINATFKTLRIPFVYIFAPFYGLAGIWWVISLTTIIQCFVTIGTFILFYNRKERNENSNRE